MRLAFAIVTVMTTLTIVMWSNTPAFDDAFIYKQLLNYSRNKTFRRIDPFVAKIIPLIFDLKVNESTRYVLDIRSIESMIASGKTRKN